MTQLTLDNLFAQASERIKLTTFVDRTYTYQDGDSVVTHEVYIKVEGVDYSDRSSLPSTLRVGQLYQRRKVRWSRFYERRIVETCEYVARLYAKADWLSPLLTSDSQGKTFEYTGRKTKSTALEWMIQQLENNIQNNNLQ